MSGFRRILMATDFSPASEAAFAEAARLARESAAVLTLLHVYENPTGAAVPYLPVSGYLESLVAARMDAEERMRHLLSSKALDGIEVRPLVARGLPAPQICETATRESADLLVMGTHGRRGAARLFLGSVASSVIAQSPCPVLTIRTPAASGRSTRSPAA